MTPTTDLKRPAWLLVLTLPAFVAYVALAVTTLATKADSSSAELTHAQLSDLGAAWIVLHILWMVPSVLAAIALLQVARAAGLRGAGKVSLLACVAVVLAAAYLVPQVLAFDFDGSTWGDSPLYPIGVGLSLAVSWAGTLPATLVVAVGLARRGIHPKVAWTVVVVTGLYFAMEILIYLPALIGSATLAETTGPPPFLLGLFWALLGASLLRTGGFPDADEGGQTRQAAPGRGPSIPLLRTAVATFGLAVVLAGCGSDDATPSSATADDRASTSATSDALATSETPVASPLEGAWHTEPTSLKAMGATLRRHGLGRWVKDYQRAIAPYIGRTVLILNIVNGEWDLYGKTGDEPPEPIDFNAEYEIKGDTVVFHHSEGSNTFRWVVDDDTLTLHFIKSTLPGVEGIPEEVFQRALYMTTPFIRQG